MAQEANLYIEAGDTFEKYFVVKDHTDSIIDLTGSTLRAQFKKDYDSTVTTSFAVAIVSATSGSISLSLTSTQTQGIGEGKYYFDCLVTFPDGSVLKVIKGVLTVYPTVTS